jgi:maltooligosyltrehalose trehalohydrolase
MIDPQDPAAYRTAILDWTELADEPHHQLLELYRALIALRAAEPDLSDPDLTKIRVDYDEQARWVVVHRGAFRVVVNLAPSDQAIAVPDCEVVLATGGASVGAGAMLLGSASAAVVRLTR